MIRYAELDENNKVINIIVGTEAGISSIPGKFIKIDINSNPSRKETCIGGEYNIEKDMFILPQPWPSWILNQETLEWHSPIGDKPNDDKKYLWDEENQMWQEIIPIEINL